MIRECFALSSLSLLQSEVKSHRQANNATDSLIIKWLKFGCIFLSLSTKQVKFTGLQIQNTEVGRQAWIVKV